MLIRERPPLRHTIEVQTPRGRWYRWATDEPVPENIPSNVRWSSTIPGGFENFDATLARNPARDYADLERLSTIAVRSAAGEIVGEYRLERAPRTSGDQMAVSPSAVGWQAHLDDDKSASMVWIDIDLGRWGPPSTERKIVRMTDGYSTGAGSVVPDTTYGGTALAAEIHGSAWDVGSLPEIDALYDAGPGNAIGQVTSGWRLNTSIDPANTDWEWFVLTADADHLAGATTSSGNLRTGTSPHDLISAGGHRFASAVLRYNAGGGVDNKLYGLYWTVLHVFGDHGLPIYGTGRDQGLHASDIVEHAVSRWAPLLSVTAAGQPTVSPSSFVIPHLAFYDPTTAGEMIKQATRFGLQDWAVWENKTFWWHERGARGRSWRARVGPAGLEETGPQLDRLWESIIVSYKDVDGSTRTVGPPGSRADTESADLKDDDPENPANKLGIVRRDLLQAGTMNAAAATEVGRRFLEQTKLLDSSGRARLVGHVEDDRGVLHPYSHVRAGDTITFVDAASPTARRIVKADHSAADRACTVDLDAPPEGLAALLERLGVVLVSLGV